MSEQFGFQKVFRDCGAVDRNELFLGTLAFLKTNRANGCYFLGY
jgi:hypothetical protein